MLKITAYTQTGTTVIELEGKLAGPWVKEFDRCWRSITSTSDRPVRVVLARVTFIDNEGQTLLREMHRRGAELVAEGCMNRAIVDGICLGKE
jgi:hypothetical protein